MWYTNNSMATELRRDKLKKIPAEIIAEVIFFPLWWYSQGFLRNANMLWQNVVEMEYRLGLRIWIKNIFTPMFGQYDWEGRIISFVMRLVQIIGRGLLLFVWFLLFILLNVFWLFLPLVVSYFIVTNIISIIYG